jgi:hypothetical protein
MIAVTQLSFTVTKCMRKSTSKEEQFIQLTVLKVSFLNLAWSFKVYGKAEHYGWSR